jgi:thiol-disulfide isomerase/thioredoxin
MNPMIRALSVVSSLAALIALGSAQGLPPKLLALYKKPAPKATFTSLSGKKIKLSSLKGKVVLLDCFATWCQPCAIMAPRLEKLKEVYGKKGLVVIGVSGWEHGDSKKAVSAYVKEHKYSYTFTYGNDAFFTETGVQSVPTFLFIDKKGIVREMAVGVRDYDVFENEVKSLLAAK